MTAGMKYTIDDGEDKIYTLQEIDTEMVLEAGELKELERLAVGKKAKFGDGLVVQRVE